MRFTSSRRSAVALLLCCEMLAQGLAPGTCRAADGAAEAALLLKYASPGIPDTVARPILDPLPGLLAGELHVRWVRVPEAPAAGAGGAPPFPAPDDAALRGIAAKLSSASSRMETVEMADAGLLLSEAERETRRYRFDEATRPFLAEIFLRKGMLKLWEGNPAEAESYLARSRALRPDFTPDPALFPPQFLAAWQRAGERPAPEAELLVQSLPSGAEIYLDGERRGTTPSRVRAGSPGVHRIRLAHPGYRDVVREGQWLPGDSEVLEFTLPGDRVSRLGEILGGPQRGAGSGTILAEIASEAGVGKVAVVMLEQAEPGRGIRARLYAISSAGGDAVPLGERVFSPGKREPVETAKWAADRMRSAGWPAVPPEGKRRPWYNNHWLWVAVVSIAVGIGIAVGGSGGGNGSGSTTGTVAVNF